MKILFAQLLLHRYMDFDQTLTHKRPNCARHKTSVTFAWIMTHFVLIIRNSCVRNFSNTCKGISIKLSHKINHCVKLYTPQKLPSWNSFLLNYDHLLFFLLLYWLTVFCGTERNGTEPPSGLQTGKIFFSNDLNGKVVTR